MIDWERDEVPTSALLLDTVIPARGAAEELERGEPQIILSVWVPGVPQPKGSMKNVAKRGDPSRLQEDNPRSAGWRAAVADALGMKTNFGRDLGWPVESAVAVDVIFVFERSASCEREAPTGQRDGGDLDKLVRNVLDAAQDGGVIRNDAQVCRIVAEKGWLIPGDGEAGAMIVFKEHW